MTRLTLTVLEGVLMQGGRTMQTDCSSPSFTVTSIGPDKLQHHGSDPEVNRCRSRPQATQKRGGGTCSVLLHPRHIRL